MAGRGEHLLARPEIKRAAEYLRERGAVHVAVFGSRARAEERPGSDLDLLVEFAEDRRPSLLELVEMERTLASLTGMRVELVTKDALHPAIRGTVLAEAVDVGVGQDG